MRQELANAVIPDPVLCSDPLDPPGGSGTEHTVADVNHAADPPDFPEGHEDPAQSAELERQQDA